MAILLTVKVFPGSGRQVFALDKSGIIKCFLKSQAEKGKANDELVKLLASTLGLGREAIVILKGVTSQRKTLKIATARNEQEVFNALGLGFQKTLTKE